MNKQPLNSNLKSENKMQEEHTEIAGSSVPEVRFKGFTDTWEQRRLGEIVDRYDNLRVPVAASERIA